MSHRTPTDLRIAGLDPDLLLTPFRIQTRWHVITGAPSSGKSTLIELLAERGFQTVPETGRLCVEAEMARGRTMDEIRTDMARMQIAVREMQMEIERGLSANDVVFLDGALPGCLAWYRAFGLNPNEILLECFHHRYASVFVLDPLPFHANGTRNGDAPIVRYLDEWIALDYECLGYHVVRVPVLPIEERLALILENLAGRGQS